jgi:hypothetical protein
MNLEALLITSRPSYSIERGEEAYRAYKQRESGKERFRFILAIAFLSAQLARSFSCLLSGDHDLFPLVFRFNEMHNIFSDLYGALTQASGILRYTITEQEESGLPIAAETAPSLPD